MSGKKIAFKTPDRPKASVKTSADDWVAKHKTGASEPMKRLTIDVPRSLHTRIKMQCAERGHKMADVIRELLNEQFSEK